MNLCSNLKTIPRHVFATAHLLSVWKLLLDFDFRLQPVFFNSVSPADDSAFEYLKCFSGSCLYTDMAETGPLDLELTSLVFDYQGNLYM